MSKKVNEFALLLRGKGFQEVHLKLVQLENKNNIDYIIHK